MCDAHSFSAVVVEPGRLVDMVKYQSDELALFNAGSGEEVIFFAGGGWQYHQKNRGSRAEPYRKTVSWQQLIEVYSGKTFDLDDPLALRKIAIAMSDGYVQCEADMSPELVEFAHSKHIPVLEYAGEENKVERLNEFYELVMGE